jgi:hypothetical protein
VSVEPERDAGEEPDLGVRRFDEALGQAGVERDVDRFAMGNDPALQENERGESGAASPADPVVERGLAFSTFDREDVA